MALVAIEKVTSRSITRGATGEPVEWSVLYGAIGTEDEEEVVTALETTLPALFKGLPFQGYKAAHQGGGVWDIDVRYSSKITKETGSSTFSFDTTGGHTKVNTSLGTTAYTPFFKEAFGSTHDGSARIDFATGTADLLPGMGIAGKGIPPGSKVVSVDVPGQVVTISQKCTSNNDLTPLTYSKKVTDYKGGINVDPDNKVQGVEVPTPSFAFNVSRIIEDPMNQSLADAFYAMKGAVNSQLVVLFISNVMYVFQIGELRFLGATGNKKGVEAWEISMRFEAEPNADGKTLPKLSFGDGADEIKDVVKLGWDYLWISYAERKDADSNRSRPIPLQVNVEKVGNYADLRVLFL